MSVTYYVFPLSVAGAGGNGISVPTYAIRYLFTPELDTDNDLVIVGSTLKAGVPCLEIVRNVLNTDYGSMTGSPTFGVRYSVIRKAARNAAELWVGEVKRALRYLVDGKHIEALQVNADPIRNGRLVYEVIFRDTVSSFVAGVGGAVVV